MLPAFQPHLPQLITPLSMRSHIYETLCSLPIFFSFHWGHLLTTHFFVLFVSPTLNTVVTQNWVFQTPLSNCTSGASVSSSGSWLKSHLHIPSLEPPSSVLDADNCLWDASARCIKGDSNFTSLALDSSPAAWTSFPAIPSKSVLGSIIHHLFEAKCEVISNLALFLTSYPIHHQRCWL